MPARCYLWGKLHGATITAANREYQGSLSIDPALMRAADIRPFERIDVYNLDNGERLTTYAIAGAPEEIALNGAAALKGAVGQRVIVASYAWLSEEEARAHAPRVVLVKQDNTPDRRVEYEPGVAGPTKTP